MKSKAYYGNFFDTMPQISTTLLNVTNDLLFLACSADLRDCRSLNEEAWAATTRAKTHRNFI